MTELFMTFTDHYDPNLHWVVAYFKGLCNYWFRNHYFEGEILFSQDSKYEMKSSISLIHYRAGSPVVKAGDFHRGGQSLNSLEIFKNLFFFLIKWLWDPIYGLKKFLSFKILIEQLNIIYWLGHAHSGKFVRNAFFYKKLL